MAKPTAFQNIVVTTDLSEASWAGLDAALALAGQVDGARLSLLSVVEPSSIAAGSPHLVGATADLDAVAKKLSAEAQEKIAAKLETLDLPVEIAVHVTDSVDPVDEICSQLESLGADIVVLATHGRTGIRHAILGSTAEKLVRKSPVPVLTVRAQGAK